MAQLYATTNEAFTAWLDSDPTENELLDAFIILRQKQANLWTPGHDDSYYRDRYERHDSYSNRIVLIQRRLASLWLASIGSV